MKTKKPAKLAALVAGVAFASFADDLALDNEAKTVSEAADATVEYGAVTLANAASLSVASGTLSATSITAGETSDDNSISVAGPDAALSFVELNFGYGNQGNGCNNTLSVSGGATLKHNTTDRNKLAKIGEGHSKIPERGCSNTATISGVGTTAEFYQLQIGKYGSDNSMRITDGAAAIVGYGVSCGSNTGTNNVLSVDGATLSVTIGNNNINGVSASHPGSMLQVKGGGKVHVAGGMAASAGGGFALSDGASLDASGNISVGNTSGGEASYISIDGAEFLATNAAVTTTFGNSSSNTLRVVNGGAFKAAGTVVLGSKSATIDSDFNSIFIAGEGSVFTANTVNVGSGASLFNAFTVTNGATMTAAIFNLGAGSASGMACSNRLEVVDGAIANITTINNALISSTNNTILVRDATLNAGSFNWRNATVLRVEGTTTKVKWSTPRGNRGGGLPLGGSSLEFVPPASVRTFSEPPVDISGPAADAVFNFNYNSENPLTVRVVDAKDCIKAGGGKYPLLRHTYEIQGSLDDVVLDAPDGVALSLSDDKKTLWVTIPGPGGFRVIIR